LPRRILIVVGVAGVALIAGLLVSNFRGGETKIERRIERLYALEDTRFTQELGMLLGAFIAAFTGGEFTAAWVPALWEQRFGADVTLRLGVAFVGGVATAHVMFRL